MKSKLKYTEALLAMARSTNQYKPDALLSYERVISMAKLVLATEHASLWLLNKVTSPNVEELTLNCLVGFCQQKSMSVTEVSHYWSFLEQQGRLVCDDVAQLSVPDDVMRDLNARFGQAGAFIHVPLFSEGSVFGVLCFYHPAAHQWTEEELYFVSLLSDQVIHVYEKDYYTRLQSELDVVSKIFTASKDAMIILSEVGIVEKVNPAFTNITGFKAEEIVGHHYPSWINQGGQTDVDFIGMCSYVTNHGHWQGELLQRRKSGQLQPVWQTMMSIKNAQNQITNFVAIESDLSSFKRAQERLHYLSHYDSLTGLPNRAEFHKKLADYLAVAEQNLSSVRVICIDIDDFKKINLSLGYAFGDQLLSIVANRLSYLDKKNGVWARLSADEFAYAVCADHRQDRDDFLQKVVEVISQPFALAGHQVRLTASVGCAEYPNSASAEGEALLRDAQAAMRSVKMSGGNNFLCYQESMNQQTIERLMLENQLAQAAGLNQLRLYYQPQIDLETGKLLGLEALIRWQHPEMGLVAPNQFIPLAEETGLIEQIGDWVLNEVCRQLAEWQMQGLPLTSVAINVSASQFIRRPLAKHIQQLIEQYNISPALLELELTERVVMNDPSLVHGIMDQLSSLGVSLSMDDFGTGYSSLSYLQKLPLNKLKVDMSFVRNIATSKNDLAITNTIINLGKNLNLQVIAEGIEIQEQKHLLMQMGCHVGQGYYFAKPMPAEEVAKILTNPDFR